MILVAGGTGRLGTIVVRDLVARGRDVRVLTRDVARASHLPDTVHVVTGDARDTAAVRDAVGGCATVVSAMHGFEGRGASSPATVDCDGNARLVDAAAAGGADVVMMSVVGASADSPMELFRMKHAAEENARASGVPVTVVRATAFMELWIEILRKTAARSSRPVVFGRGRNPINFVSVDDVAALVDLVTVDASTRGETIEIGGPDDMTFDALARMVQRAAGSPGAPRHVPRAVLRFAAATVGRLDARIGRQTRAALAMDDAELTFDSSATRRRYPGLPCTRVGDVLDRCPPAG